MTKAEAFHNFWSQFGLTAYEENSTYSLEKQPVFPYLTYELTTGNISDNSVSLSTSLWYRSSSWVQANEKEQEITETIGYGGVRVPYDGGFMWIMRNGGAKRMGDPSDDFIKRVVIDVSVMFISEN